MMPTHDWLLKRNCSLAPNQLGLAFAILCVLSLCVAAPFVMHGAWQILAFALLEMMAVAAAFLHYARHATDHEHVRLADGCLLVERELGMRKLEVRLDARRARVLDNGAGNNLVRVEAGNTRVQVGRFVTEANRRRFAEELRNALREAALDPLPALER